MRKHVRTDEQTIHHKLPISTEARPPHRPNRQTTTPTPPTPQDSTSKNRRRVCDGGIDKLDIAVNGVEKATSAGRPAGCGQTDAVRHRVAHRHLRILHQQACPHDRWCQQKNIYIYILKNDNEDTLLRAIRHMQPGLALTAGDAAVAGQVLKRAGLEDHLDGVVHLGSHCEQGLHGDTVVRSRATNTHSALTPGNIPPRFVAVTEPTKAIPAIVTSGWRACGMRNTATYTLASTPY